MAKVKQYNVDNRERILAMNRAYHKKHNKRLRELQRQINTGFSPDLFETTVKFQNGKCGICEKELSEMPSHHIHADHCHATGQPRGVLCHNCNTSIGRLGDNIEGIKKENDMANTVTAEYIMGIKEGREYFDTHGSSNVVEILANLNSTIKGFAAATPVGQVLRGERDFWKNQLRKTK
ncbi:hypothetical protein Q3G72_018810 [Acer saccharum]|nr:hypothetical protein Q3G72_018810 [Acer saccharum]